jgi:acyl-CoA dehydrogenase
MPDIDTVRAFLDDAHIALSKRVTEFCRDEILPLPATNDDASARKQAKDILKRLGNAGLIAHAHPLDLRACCLVREALAAASPLADEVFALQCLGSTPIATQGSDELKAQYLPGAQRGDLMAAFAMTEPDAGSDVARLGTRATKEGDSYVLDGKKTLISNAGIADFYTVFAKTDPDAGHRGISAFVVDATTPGFHFLGPQELSAPHPLGEIELRACRVPVARRIGAEGAGFRLGMSTLDSLRATVGAAACGMAERALEEALSHTLTREQFGERMANFQLVQAKLSNMAMQLAASRLLVYRAAWEKDRGTERVSLPSAMAKSFATEAAQHIVDDAVQLVGGRAVLASHPLDRLYRAIRPLRIYEGATDIQHLVIARAMIKSREGVR